MWNHTSSLKINNSPRRTATASKFPSHISGVNGEDDGILCLSSCPLWSSTVSSSPVYILCLSSCPLWSSTVSSSPVYIIVSSSVGEVGENVSPLPGDSSAPVFSLSSSSDLGVTSLSPFSLLLSSAPSSSWSFHLAVVS